AAPSPSGEYVLVEAMHKPFSYLVPAYRFPNRIEVRDLDGNLVKEIADVPLAEGVPTAFGSVPTGIRSIDWRADDPATLYWAEALDGGDARAEAEYRDQVYMLEAPFDAEPTPLVKLPLRYGGVTWGDDDLALVSESWFSTRKRRVYVVDPSQPGQEPRVLFDLSTEDRYNNPGSPLRRQTEQGTSVLLTADDGQSIFLSGTGASPEGNRPFLRKMDLETGETEELFRSEAPYYEFPVTLLDPEAMHLMTRRESSTEPPNYFVRDLRSGSLTAATDFPHPYPELADIQKESIQYEREDGIPLSATLYLPAGYDAERDGPLPAFVWAYPREFKSARAAGQRSDSPYQFKRVSYWGAVPYVTQGYAVIDNASMPVIGEGEQEPNDTFREQLVANARAAIDEGMRRGVVDPERVAIGGHSYGAFMTANLLAHSDLFRAGIARSGAYNRTLTPFGFQREERLFWEAPEIYYYMSPFMHADKVNEPILLIHGEADNNSGTFPLQSRRYYSALKGLGKTARLVMLPHESHGYRARESIMHMLWETNRWLETYVKNAPPREQEVKVEGPIGDGR
ncbi:MAG: S9 family peptidase, partial [Bacteroidetes bacterium]|nr:S9 family peptidase [Bacteroidota bacterium]